MMDDCCCLWDLEAGRLLQTLPITFLTGRDTCFTGDDNRIVHSDGCCHSKEICNTTSVWDAAAGNKLFEFASLRRSARMDINGGGTDLITSRDGRFETFRISDGTLLFDVGVSHSVFGDFRFS
jgi:hypothetical protein